MRLSLIMPIYNGSKYITKTISHILNTNSYDFELLLVNDGSKDDSEEICEKYIEKDNRVRLFSKKNGGIADARNAGLDNATGEYLAFVDQDDFIELDKIINLLDNSNEDIIIFSTVKDYGDRKEPCDAVSAEKVYSTKKDIFDKCIWPMVYPVSNIYEVSYFGHVWQGIYKNNIINSNKIKFKKFVSIEDDFIFLLEAFLASNSVRLVPTVGYRWVINAESTTYKKNYIKNMQEKCEKYYAYTNEELKKSLFYNSDYESKYVKMAKQVLGVRLVINEGYNDSIFGTVTVIKNYINENKQYFKGEYLGKGASRKTAKYLYFMLKWRMSLSAVIFQRFIILCKTGGKK